MVTTRCASGTLYLRRLRRHRNAACHPHRYVHETDLLRLAEALKTGGLTMMEVAFDQADPDCLKKTPEAIAMIKEHFKDKMKCGAATVLTEAQVQAAAEANVCVSLSRFGKETEFISRFPDNDITDATLCKLRQYGVGLNHIILGGDRVGFFYLERGASQRPSKVVYDRKYSSISMSKREDYDWEAILDGVDWFHFTGITAALSEEMPAICEDACRVARSKGINLSCDLNYRKNLWTPEQAREVMRKLIGYVDVLIGNEEDAEKTLGIVPAETDVTEGRLNYGAYKDLAASICKEFGVKKVGFTLRTSISASDNKWAAMLYSGGEAHYSKEYLIHMVDRVGGGDSFAAGLIYALREGWEAQKAIEFAVAASCLKQTMEQDFNLSSVSEVLHLMEGDGSGRVQR